MFVSYIYIYILKKIQATFTHLAGRQAQYSITHSTPTQDSNQSTISLVTELHHTWLHYCKVFFGLIFVIWVQT